MSAQKRIGWKRAAFLLAVGFAIGVVLSQITGCAKQWEQDYIRQCYESGGVAVAGVVDTGLVSEYRLACVERHRGSDGT